MRTEQSEWVRLALTRPCRDGDVYVLKSKCPPPPEPDPDPEPEAA